jgi:hypothetical protein
MMSLNSYSIADMKLIDLPKFSNRAGNITALNSGVELPFEIQRIFYLYDIPGGESRGAHAHKVCVQLLVAASGSFTVSVDDGQEQKHFFLNQPYRGLLIPPGIWASEIDFSSGATCLVLASHVYDEMDYIRNYDEFRKFKRI